MIFNKICSLQSKIDELGAAVQKIKDTSRATEYKWMTVEADQRQQFATMLNAKDAAIIELQQVVDHQTQQIATLSGELEQNRKVPDASAV